MLTVNHPPEAVRHDGKTGSSETLIGWKSPNGGSVAVDSVMKSNTVTHFKIISGLRNSLQKKQFEEGYWKDFHK